MMSKQWISRDLLYALLAVLLLGPNLPLANESDVGSLTGLGMTLTGSTDHPMLVQAAVEVVVNGQVFSGTTDADGRYSVPISCIDPEAIAIVYVEGTGSQSHIRASRVVDSCSLLSAASVPGQDFEVGAVTPLSTAVYVALRWYVDRSPSLTWPLTGTELIMHRHAIDLGVANTILFNLPSLIAEHLPLPAGKSNTLEVLLDRQALLEFQATLQADVDSEVISSAQYPILWSGRSVLRTSVLSSLEYNVMYCPAIASLCTTGFWKSGSQPYFGWATTGGEAELLPRDFQDQVFGDDYAVPEDNLRAVRLTRQGGQPLSFSISFINDPVHGQIERRIYTDFQDLRLLDASESIDLGSLVEQYRISYPGGELPEEILDQAVPSMRTVVRSDAELPVWAGPSAGESWYVPLFLGASGGSSNPFRWDRLTFNGDGTGQADLLAAPFNWSLSSGVMEIDGLGNHQFRLIGGDMTRHPLFEVIYQPATAGVRANVMSLIKDNNPPAFSLANVPGRYWGGFDLDELRLLPQSFPQTYLTYEFQAGGVGWRAFMADPMDPARPPTATDLTWEIDAAGRLVVKRESFGSFFSRAWTPMAVHGPTQDMYMIENGPYFVSDPAFDPPVEPGRLNFYRKIELGDL